MYQLSQAATRGEGGALFHCELEQQQKFNNNNNNYSRYKKLDSLRGRGITPDLHPSVSTAAAEGLNASTTMIVDETRATPLLFRRSSAGGGGGGVGGRVNTSGS